MVESSIMIAFATVLSMLKLVDMPYGGSVTAASMLPIVIVSYRHGLGMGLGSGLVFAVIQQLLGLNTLSYAVSWQSVVAIIVIDYVLAFTVIGFGGIFKGKFSSLYSSLPRSQSAEIGLGVVSVCILRYICHTIAGATVWVGLSIPSEAALLYSLGYNATYMLPETIVTAISAVWIGSVLDLSKRTPERFTKIGVENAASGGACELLPHLATLLAVIAVALDTLLIAPHLQNAESGAFDFSGAASAPWGAIAVISAVGIAGVLATFFAKRRIQKKNEG